MAILVKTYQDKRKTGNNLWYGRAWHPSILDLKALAKRIEQNTTLTYADCLAVLQMLIKVMTNQMGMSNKVLLDGIGYFYPAARTSGALSKKDFTIGNNIKDIKVIFTPQRETNAGTGITSKGLTPDGGFKFQMLSEEPAAVNPNP